MRRVPRRVQTALGAAWALMVLGIGSPASSSAATNPVFPSPLTTLTAPGVVSDQDPQVVMAVNRRGDAVAAWKLYRQGPTLHLDYTSEVQVSFHRRSDAPGVWSAPERISAQGWRSVPEGGKPVLVGIDESGVATISWTETSDGSLVLPPSRQRIVTHGPGGFGPVQEIPEGGLHHPADLAVGPDGQAVLAHVTGQGGVITRRRASATGAFGGQVAVGPTERYATSVDVAMNADGQAALAWSSSADGQTAILMSRAAPGAAFSAPEQVASAPEPAPNDDALVRPAVALDRAGAATVLWTEVGALGDGPREFALAPVSIWARAYSAQGTAAAAQRITTMPDLDSTARELVRARLGADDQGKVTAAWATNPGQYRAPEEATSIQAATAQPGAAFGAPQTLADRVGLGEPEVAVDPSGTTAIVWGGSAIPASVAWRPAGADAFWAPLQPTTSWVRGVAASFGRADELTLALGIDLAPTSIVQATTIGSEPGPEPVSVSVRDTTKPVLSVKGVAVVKAPRKKGKKQPSRLTVTLAASEDASVRAVVSQARKGIKRGGACVKRPSSPKARKGRKACTRTVVIGPEVGAPVGQQTTSIDLGAAPPKGAYTLTVKSRDAAGNAGDAVAYPFTVR